MQVAPEGRERFSMAILASNKQGEFLKVGALDAHIC
jgi:hypothetical protein